MSNWAGRFKSLVTVFLVMLLAAPVWAADEDEFKFDTNKWEKFSKDVELQNERDRKNGLSYVISGSLALIGGIIGDNVSEDTSEKGIYTVFQTIGVASIGYGAYRWQIGGEERSLYRTLQLTGMTADQKSQFLQAYNSQRKEREKRDRRLRAITHGLIAGLNFYNATQQSQSGLKNTLYFIGGVNMLAAISFTFEF